MLNTRAKPTMVAVKSRLAQMLASENIRVIHLPVKTACFVLKERTLVCPIWKDMDGDLYDLCMGHEVGHALNTPPEGWHGALEQMGRGYQSYMNVVEDARIERKIKTLFPGLKAPFARAYVKLAERDMFGIQSRNIDINKLGLIDRLNLHFKASHIYPVQFTDEERTYITRIERADTWEQVREIADELYLRAKKNKDKLPQTSQDSDQGQDSDKNDDGQQGKQQSKGKKPSKQQESEKSINDMDDDELTDALNQDPPGAEDDENEYGDDGEGSESDEDDGETGDGEADESDTSEEADEVGEDADTGSTGNEDNDDDAKKIAEALGNQGEEDESDSKDKSKQSRDDAPAEKNEKAQGATQSEDFVHSHDHVPEQQDPTSLTDEAFRDNEESLVDEKATGIRTCYLPEGDANKMVAPIKSVYTSIEQGIQRAFDSFTNPFNNTRFTGNLQSFASLSANEVLKDNKKYIDMLVKEFELRKNATQYSRSLTAKTGELDTSRLDKYRFTNDLFKKITTVPKGKSHGMVFFLDMSSSMQEIMGKTVKQLLVLVTFCKKVNVPFEVYGFCDASHSGFRPANFNWYQPDVLQCHDRGMHLKHLLSSQLRGGEYKRAFNALAMYSNIFYNEQTEEVRKFLMPDNSSSVQFSEHDLNMALGGTPFNQMLLASRQLIEEFKLRTQTDIVNVIHLTDGDGTDSLSPPQVDYSSPNYREMDRCRVAYTDRKSGVSIVDKWMGSQTILTMMVKQITGCRHIAFYVGSAWAIKHVISHQIDVTKSEREELKRQMKDVGFIKVAHKGYDSYYYMQVDKQASEEMSSDDSVAVEKRFIQHQKDKARSRQLAKQFAAELAEQLKR